MFTPNLEVPERGLLSIGFNHRRFRRNSVKGGIGGRTSGDSPVHHRPSHSRFPSLQLGIQIPRRLSGPIRLRELRIDNSLLGRPGRSKVFQRRTQGPDFAEQVFLLESDIA